LLQYCSYNFKRNLNQLRRIHRGLQKIKKDRVKDSTWRSKYDPILTNVIKAMKSKSKALINANNLCLVALKQCQKWTTNRRHMRLVLYGFLRLLVVELQFESIWLLSAVTDKNLLTNKKIGYPIIYPQIIGLFPGRWYWW